MKLPALVAVLLLSCLLSMTAGATDPGVSVPSDAKEITVYRDPDCSCCHRWIQHLQRNGFHVEDRQTDKLALLKQDLNVPDQLASCHTAAVNGYIIEGHVPAADIQKLLREQPDIRGLAVPGMPAGSPGMEMGRHREEFSVIQFDRQGKLRIYEHYPAN